MSIRSINDGASFGGRHEETREDANEIRIRIIDLLHTNLYVVTHMYQFVATLFYSIPLLALTHRQTDRQMEK